MNIVKLGVIIDVGITKEEAKKYKYEKGFQKYLLDISKDFAQSLREINGFDIGYVINRHQELTISPNFNYSITNEAKENKDYYVFRYFGTSLFLKTSRKNLSLSEFDSAYWYEKDSIIFSVFADSLGEQFMNVKKPTFLGSTNRNTSMIPVTLK